MTETRNLICSGCPMGCPLTVTLEGGQIREVTGNTCKRGEEYARREVTHPTRVLTTTLPVLGGERPTLPVRTLGEIPKEMVVSCARALQGVTVEAPVEAGQVVVENLGGTGVDLVATRTVQQSRQARSAR